MLGHDPPDDGGDGLPAGAQQPGDGGLVGVLAEPGDDVFEVAGVAGPRSGPVHRLGADPVATGAVQTADLGLEEQLRRRQVQMPPPAR